MSPGKGAGPTPMRQARDLIDALGRIESARMSPEAQERRGFWRYPIRAEARLEPLDAHSLEAPVGVLLREMSRAGAGFLADRALRVGSLWRLRFERDGHAIGAQPISVRHCTPVRESEALHLIGAQFLIEPYILALLGVPREAPRPGEGEGEADAAFLPPDRM